MRRPGLDQITELQRLCRLSRHELTFSLIVAIAAPTRGADGLGNGVSAPRCGLPGWNGHTEPDRLAGHPRSKMHFIASMVHSPSRQSTS
jgi:hypothetical protein